MKTAKLKNGLICISVPKDEGLITWDRSKYIELGTITKDECSFDLIDDLGFTITFDNFKSIIESETEFLFENPNKKPNIREMLFFEGADDFEKWEQSEKRVIEKLLMLKTI